MSGWRRGGQQFQIAGVGALGGGGGGGLGLALNIKPRNRNLQKPIDVVHKPASQPATVTQRCLRVCCGAHKEVGQTWSRDVCVAAAHTVREGADAEGRYLWGIMGERLRGGCSGGEE